MKLRTMMLPMFLAAALATGTTTAATDTGPDAAGAPVPQVVKLLAGSPVTYSVDKQYGKVRRGERLAEGALALPAPVLDTSPRGYVQVQGADGPVWLDNMDVEIDPPVRVDARCLSNITKSSTTTTAAALGAGEGC